MIGSQISASQSYDTLKGLQGNLNDSSFYISNIDQPLYEVDEQLLKVFQASTNTSPYFYSPGGQSGRLMGWSNEPGPTDNVVSDSKINDYENMCSVIQVGYSMNGDSLYLQGYRKLDNSHICQVFKTAQEMLSDVDLDTGIDECPKATGLTKFLQKPCFILIRVYNRSNTPRWILINYLPKTITPRDKVLFCGAHLAIEQKLIARAADLFAADHFICSSMNDLTYNNFLVARNKTLYRRSAMPLTQVECLRFSEALAETYVDALNGRFKYSDLKTSPTLATLTKRFVAFQESCLMMTIEIKTCRVVCESLPYDLKYLANRLYAKEPRYYMTRLSKSSQSTIFFLSCPDGSTKQHRILYASCKRCVMNMLTTYGVEIKKSLEVRSAASDLIESVILGAPDLVTRNSGFAPASRASLKPGLASERPLAAERALISDTTPKKGVGGIQSRIASDYFKRLKNHGFDFSSGNSSIGI